MQVPEYTIRNRKEIADSFRAL